MFFYCGESHSSRCASGLLRYPYVLLSPSATKSDLFFHFPQFPNRQRAFTYPFSSSPHFHFHTRSSLPSPSPFYCRPSPFPQLLIFLDFSQRTSNSNRNAKAAPHRSPPPEHAAGSSRELQSHLFSLTKIISQLFLVSDLVLLSHLFCSLHPKLPFSQIITTYTPLPAFCCFSSRGGFVFLGAPFFIYIFFISGITIC